MNEPTVATLEQDLEEAKARITELEKENFDLQIQVEEGERQFKSDQHDIVKLTTKVTELQCALSDYEDEVEKETPFPCETMHDQMKRDYLLEIWDKYSPEEIENALPRRY